MHVKQLPIRQHYSSREGGRIHLLSLHTTEGEGTLEDLRNLFENEEASAHYGADGQGEIGQFVQDKYKAWSQCNYNPVCLSLEQIGFAAWSREYWMVKRQDQLKAAGVWLTYGHIQYGVPLRHGEVSGGGIVKDGVVEHRDLGLIGCGHSDCGDGYPFHYVLLLARFYIARKLHPGSDFTLRLKSEINNIRKHYGIQTID